MESRDNERLELQTKAFITDLLAGVNTEESIQSDINYIMDEVGTFTHADRIYVYKSGTGKDNIKKVYQWLKDDSVKQDDSGSDEILIMINRVCSDTLEKSHLVVIENTDSVCGEMSGEYGMMAEMGLNSLMVIPIYANDRLIAHMSLINPDYQVFSSTEKIWLYLGQQIGALYRRDRFNHKYLLFMNGIRSGNLSEFIVDCKTKRYEAFRVTKILRDIIPYEGDWDWLRQFYSSIINQEYRENVLRRTEMEYIEEFLCTEKSTYTIDLEREAEGKNNWFRLEFSVVSLDEEGHLECFVLQVKDITQMKKEEEEHQQMIKALGSIYNASIIIDLTEKIIQPIKLSGIALKFISNEPMPYETALDIFCNNMIQEEYVDIVRDFMNLDTIQERVRNNNRLICEYQGTKIEWGLINLIPSQWSQDGTLEKIVFALQDITEQKHREEWMQYKIEHDELTGTFNRVAFNRITKLLESSVQPFAFVLMDIDKFKTINDTYGHDVGDEVLSRLVVVLNEKMRTSDKIFRLGGDEFVVIMNRITVERAGYVKQIIDSVNEAIMSGVDGLPAFSVSAGVSFSISGYNEIMYHNADKALYMTKETTRRGCTIYEEMKQGQI